MSRSHDRTSEQIEAEIEHTRHEMSETIDAIQNKLSPGQLLDQAMQYVRSGPGDFASNLGATIKNNPVPVTLVGIGLAWLMMSRSNGGWAREDQLTDMELDSTVGIEDEYVSGTADAAVGSYQATGEAYEARPAHWGEPDDIGVEEDASRAGYGMGSAARENSASWAGSATERAGHTTHSARDRMSEMAGGARDRVGRMTSGTRKRMGHLGSGVRGQARRIGGVARHQTDRAGSGFRYLVQEQPLVLAGIGIAVGAAIGAMLPATRREDEWMGEARDELLDAAKERGRAQIKKADRVLGAAEQAAKEEADKQGLTPNAAREQVRDTKGKVEKVATAARDAAKEEANRQGGSEGR